MIGDEGRAGAAVIGCGRRAVAWLGAEVGCEFGSAVLALRLQRDRQNNCMKRSEAIALTALTAALAAGVTVYFMNRRNTQKRKDFVANAGYEMAYDIHYPLKYRRHKRHNGHRTTM